MWNRVMKTGVMTLIGMSINGICNAQDTMQKKYPTAVLVEIRTEQNRVKAVARAKKYKMLEELNKDVAGVANAMINDFKDNFDHCPVYYYADTNSERIARKNFSGILYNADSSTVVPGLMNSLSRNYLVIQYGQPAKQKRNEPTAATEDRAISSEPKGKGLILCNEKLQQVSFIYKFDYENVFVNKKKNKQYIYKSRHFDIDYYPYAEQLNAKLKKGDGKSILKHRTSS